MRTVLLVALTCTIAFAADVPSNTSRPSPDGKWLVAWHCADTWQPDSCSIALSRRSDGRVFFTHHTSDRYIEAVWSADSRSCVLLDAPDNANSYLWLFRVRGRDIATEKLNYESISKAVEAAVPAARPREHALTRSGIEKIDWPSSSELRLRIIYNNVPVTTLLDIANPGSPKIRVASNET